jgi:hypothetical protein
MEKPRQGRNNNTRYFKKAAPQGRFSLVLLREMPTFASTKT